MINCLLTGVGGQGIVLASNIISKTAMSMGETVRTAETIGMAQRGGSVVSHVRIGESFSPLIPKKTADIIIAFEPAEAVRTLPYIKEDGVLVVSDKALQPVTSSLMGKGYDVNEMLDFLKENVKNIEIVNAEEICNACGSAKILNTALIGATLKTGVLGMSEEQVSEVIKNNVAPRFVELNLKALSLGMGK